MKKLLLLPLLILSLVTYSQSVWPIRADRTRLYRVGGSNELQIENSTRDSVNGFLMNIGNGLTRFEKIRQVSDSSFTIGTDTIVISGTGGGGGSDTTGGACAAMIYSAKLSQAGTAAPTATELNNETSTTVTWTRTGVGVYTTSSGGAFAGNIVFMTANNGTVFSENKQISTFISGDELVINTGDATSTTLEDAILNEFHVLALIWDTTGTYCSGGTIDCPPGGGDVTGGKSLGGGLPVFDGEVVDTLTFNSLFLNDFNVGSNLIAIDWLNTQAANATQHGKLTSTDWVIFNNKGNGTVTSVATNTGTGITGGTITGAGTLALDTTFRIATLAMTQKKIDSLANDTFVTPRSVTIVAPDTLQLVNDELSPGINMVYGTDGAGVKGWVPGGGGSGSVTSVATNDGTGIYGGTITTTGTLAIDTFNIATRLLVQMRIDSLALDTFVTPRSVTIVAPDTLQLVNDELAPGNNQVYGTDGSGVKGWFDAATGGTITLGAVGTSPNANAATLTGTVLNLEPANATNPGVITSGNQTFGGIKTFNSNIRLPVGSFNVFNTAARIMTIEPVNGAIAGANIADIWNQLYEPTTITAAVESVTSNDFTFFLANATSNNVTFNLLAGSSGVSGRPYIFKRIDASGNTVTINADAGQTIDGAPSKTLAAQYSTLAIAWAGTEWHVLYSN